MNVSGSSVTPKAAAGPKLNLILAAVLIAVSAFAYVYEFKLKGKRDTQAEAQSKLIPIELSAETESVTIIDKEKGIDLALKCLENCSLSNPTAHWEIAAPIQFKADEGNVGSFVSGLASAHIQETVPLEGAAEAKLKEFGLDSPKRDARKVVLKLKNEAEPYTVFIGDNAAIGDNVYVYVTGPKKAEKAADSAPSVRIIPGFIKSSIERNLGYWRAKRIFGFGASQVKGILLKNPAGTVELKREGTDWYLYPNKKAADNEALDTFITGLVFMNAHDYVSDEKNKDAKKLGLAGKPKYLLTIETDQPKPVVLSVYDVTKDGQNKVYATLADKEYVIELDRTHLDKLGKTADSFRLRSLITPTEKGQLAKLELKLGSKEKFDFSSEGSAWKLSQGQLENFDPSTVESALAKVGAARIAEFLKTSSIPSGNSQLSSWKLFSKEGKVLREFAIYGTDAKGEFYVKLPSGEAAKLERGSGSAIPWKRTDFQKKSQ